MEERALDLTDEEWVRLIDGDCEDSGLPRCCANISALRDELITICREGRKEPIMAFRLHWLKQKLVWAISGHELTDMPIIKKIIDQMGWTVEELLAENHEAQPLEKV